MNDLRSSIERVIALNTQITALENERDTFDTPIRVAIKVANEAYFEAQREVHLAFRGKVHRTNYECAIPSSTFDEYKVIGSKPDGFIVQLHDETSYGGDRDEYDWSIGVPYEGVNLPEFVANFRKNLTAEFQTAAEQAESAQRERDLLELARLQARLAGK